VYLAAGDTYNFSPDWYGPLTLGSSDGGFFWPSFRGDGIINSRWMARKQFIATFGASVTTPRRTFTAITVSSLAALTPSPSRGFWKKEFASNRAVHASALHHLRYAYKHSDRHCLLFMGHDLVFPISPVE
jgi:hypothetical protein